MKDKLHTMLRLQQFSVNPYHVCDLVQSVCDLVHSVCDHRVTFVPLEKRTREDEETKSSAVVESSGSVSSEVRV